MTDEAPTADRPTIPEGSEYVVFFDGGPSDGRNDTRVSTDGSYDDEIVDYVLIEGTETAFVYKATKAHFVNDQLQVRYAVDLPDSDPTEDAEDRNQDLN
ncbi:oligoribonuclease [Frondihabitans cladoniiphilus]|uniref:Uncharacterized protein n=1 Tax=Frondihabitans cladoniiphilus TaxID=715785 RepID=A0ABP8VT65_9MICO